MTKTLQLKVVRYFYWMKRGMGKTEGGKRLTFEGSQLAEKGITTVRRGDLLIVEAAKAGSGRYVVTAIKELIARGPRRSAESDRVAHQRRRTETQADEFFQRP